MRVPAAVHQAPRAEPNLTLAARQRKAPVEVEEGGAAGLARALERQDVVHDLDAHRGGDSLVQVLDRLHVTPGKLFLQHRFQDPSRSWIG